MTFFKPLAISAILVSGFASSAISGTAVLPGNGEFTKFGAVEGWTIYTDVERASCLIERVDANSNVVQMGLTADHNIGYLGVFSRTANLKSGKEKLFIDIDGTPYWSKVTKMKKNITEGYTGGYILADNPQFIDDLAKKYIMTVFPKKEAAFQIDLKGTYKAIKMARECNAQHN